MPDKNNKSTSSEPIKVFKWDGVAVKNALDDAITEVEYFGIFSEK